MSCFSVPRKVLKQCLGKADEALSYSKDAQCCGIPKELDKTILCMNKGAWGASSSPRTWGFRQ